MNRRDFLNLSKKSIFLGTAFASSKLFANEPPEIRSKYFYILKEQESSFNSIREKLTKIQRYVGYGNFNILGFDDALKIATRVSNIGAFTKDELEFIEYIFYYNPSVHGFYGKKIARNLTDTIKKKDVYKVPGTGHYLFKGHPLETYNEMIKDVGNSLVLTSGIRSVVKQMKLFFDKVASVNGNITVAAISLAPPAYTYHFIGDFDVGKRGFGYANFTSRFALTDEFRKIRRLSYVDVRYTVNNKDGVRYEPWHITTI
ncbi:MAG: D-alanyl-D-alanine carboxypeptidase family protein [Campylobacterota bacterium]